MLTLVLALAFGLVLVCCAGSEADAGTATDDFCRRLDSLSAEGRHSELVAEAVPAYAAVRESGDAAARLRIGCRIGRAYYCLFDPDSMYRYFDDATAGADSSGMSHERIMMLNTMGVFNMVNAINYSQALDYFYQAMNLASESGDRGDYYRSLTNVTIIHYYIGGSMIFSRPSNVIKLIKPVNEVKVVVDKPATIEKGGYLYMKVMRGTYSNVTVAVTTDQNTYLFENGTFDLTDPDASLFKVNLSLNAGKVEPKTLYYKEISEGEVFTADAKYLIARKRSDTEYHVAATFSTYYLDAVAFEADENGIEATSDVSQYAFTIAPVEGTEYVTLYSEAVSNSAPSAMYGKGYVGSPATSYVDPGHFVRGSEEDFDNPAAPLRYYWKITFEDGLPVIGSVQVDGYRIAYELWGMQFAPCKSSNTDTEPIVILKLEE